MALGPAGSHCAGGYDMIGDRTRRGDIAVNTDFRDGHLRLDDLEKPLTGRL